MLKLLGTIYGVGVALRNALYDRGVLKSHSLGARTISIGNITTGGTGKTPLVAYVAEILADAGEKVCILTRGYGRKSSGRVLVSDGENVLVDARAGGDEPVELAGKLMGKAIVIADADRVSAAAWAKERFGVTAFVLDDAFQHRRAKRDLDIVCIDATNPFGNERMLPAGRLREPVPNIARASAIVITRSDLAGDVSELRSQIATLNPTAPVFLAKTRITNLEPIGPERTAFAFCGLANPDNFFELLRRNDIGLKGTRTFPDHHYYTQEEVTELERRTRETGAEVLLTTVKDGVKLANLRVGLPCQTVEIRTEVDNAEAFRTMITSSP
jgi:tetraacyldisaccharide 4'-kinase